MARKRSGRPIAAADARIAVICARRGAALAARGTEGFVGTGVALVNPWDATAG
ncbi:hypothetical protein [Mangrovactinospora gilvigrisea]|uniref:hypothetical protein n=1 Tax=Mangrovactinospora gilvigrisea TaxID=1428644 RepID=UPI000AE2BB2B|nr:hypothetical protein [Mangrovactinospora gilvigrisea]